MGTIMTTVVGAAAYTTLDYAFFLLNLGIIAAYMTLVVVMAFPGKIMPVLCYVFSKRSRWSVAAFFFMASLTRAELAWNAVNESQIAQCPNIAVHAHRVVCLVEVSPSIIILHILQVIVVWLMLYFLGRDLFTKFKIVRTEKE